MNLNIAKPTSSLVCPSHFKKKENQKKVMQYTIQMALTFLAVCFYSNKEWNVFSRCCSVTAEFTVINNMI